jgi:hypothetical protein
VKEKEKKKNLSFFLSWTMKDTISWLPSTGIYPWNLTFLFASNLAAPFGQEIDLNGNMKPTPTEPPPPPTDIDHTINNATGPAKVLNNATIALNATMPDVNVTLRKLQQILLLSSPKLGPNQVKDLFFCLSLSSHKD